MHFVICDDDLRFRAQLREYSERLAKELDQPLRLTEFTDGLELLEAFPGDANLVFLDIQMAHVDGVETARKIRQLDKDVCIIFITNMVQYALECYKVHAYSFLPKPLRYAEFRTEVSDAVRLFLRRSDPAVLVEDIQGRQRRIPVSELLYLEVMDHRVTLHLYHEQLTVRKNLREFEEELTPLGFLRCHVSFLVNARKVTAIRTSDLTMQNGDTVPVSKQRRKRFQEEFTQYAGGLL